MSEWISVKDRLPDKEGRYIVYENIVYPFVEISTYRDKKWYSYGVEYWMPLPELPEDINK